MELFSIKIRCTFQLVSTRLELSPEKLLAFQTDGEKWNKLQEIYKEAGSMETAIEKYKQLKQKSYETEMSM